MTDQHRHARPDDVPDGLGRLTGVAAAVGALAALVAAATFWLLLMEPGSVAVAVESGEITPVVQALAYVLYSAFLRLFEFF